MRKIVILAAAASVLGGISFAAPASATGICSPWVHQMQCSFNIEWHSGSDQSITPTQTINGNKHTDLYGLIQAQLGVNVSVKAGGDQSITQDQTLNLGRHDDAGGGWFYGPVPVQNQLAANVQYKANVDQSITQSQNINSHDDVWGPQQGQTALNVAVESHGGSQTITQSQSINLD
jgi:hypothetical protein